MSAPRSPVPLDTDFPIFPTPPYEVYCEADHDRPVFTATADEQVAVYSGRGPHKPPPNEDSAGIARLGADGVVLVVADGVGGARAGHTASRLVVEALHAELGQESAGEGLVREHILRGLERASARIIALGLGAGSTAAVAWVQGDSVQCFHVGDSVALIFGQRGKLKLETTCHSPVGYLVKSGNLDADLALHHEDRHFVSNVVGSADMSIEMSPAQRLAPRDTLLLATDGLTDNLSLSEIADIVRKGPLGPAATRLAASSRARMVEPSRDGAPCKPDDCTFILFRSPSRSR